MAEIDWQEIREVWETTSATIREIGTKYGVSPTTISSRKSREKWVKQSIPGLTPKQRHFCLNYLKYFNATKAYEEAYGSSPASRKKASRLMKKPEIQKEINRVKDELIVGAKLDIRHVIQQYVDIAFSDIGDFVEWGTEEVPRKDGKGTERRNYMRFKESSEVDSSVIEGIASGKSGRFSYIRLHDKMGALGFLLSFFDSLGSGTKKDMDEKRLRLQIAKMEADIQEESGQGQTVIVEGLDEMERYMRTQEDATEDAKDAT